MIGRIKYSLLTGAVVITSATVACCNSKSWRIVSYISYNAVGQSCTRGRWNRRSGNRGTRIQGWKSREKEKYVRQLF